MNRGWLLFSDIDDALMNTTRADFQTMLQALQTREIPLILVSSRTLAELEVIMLELGIEGPVVAENGAVIAYPSEETQIAPPGYLLLRDFLVDQRANPAFDCLGFGDMSLEEIMRTTGLTRDTAQRAMQRLASEPLFWQGNAEDLNYFRQVVARAGLRLTQTEGFLYLQGHTDKGRAVQYVVNHLKNRGITVNRTIAIGDSDADRELLLAVDIPVIVNRQTDSSRSLSERPDALIADQPWPAGWSQAILDLLQRLAK
ncbi:MAG: HAD-IIB family hydrolase [Candidatus Thiodiazotropha sp. (ex Dulcina madagascariensis)]|nr:HAD-IIB family hydrolase [Candidatus Thiodiazotropha sp. (ex Epidulcina cf. delphinae)]MCU7921150.1 HAD-IIB family hydrolase [Candidatus Thiodiazotropha sp. (ex Dulcina madagascariensis)]MCU7927426.1 HAD-IIB family hydrolase [Candidatus Thiodiazotropha sp. (ex Dulcina madagascariensis)]